jgi:hypothetical protein
MRVNAKYPHHEDVLGMQDESEWSTSSQRKISIYLPAIKLSGA